MFDELHGVPVFNDSRDNVAAAIVAAMSRLSDSTRGHGVPGVDIVRDILARTTTTTRGRWRFLARPRDSRDNVAAVFLHRLAWHTGRGSANLTGVFFDCARVADDTFQLLDTTAALISHSVGRLGNSHSTMWQKITGV